MSIHTNRTNRQPYQGAVVKNTAKILGVFKKMQFLDRLFFSFGSNVVISIRTGRTNRQRYGATEQRKHTVKVLSDPNEMHAFCIDTVFFFR